MMPEDATIYNCSTRLVGVCHLMRYRHLLRIHTRRRGDKDPRDIIRPQVYGRILALGILVGELRSSSVSGEHEGADRSRGERRGAWIRTCVGCEGLEADF